MQGIALQGDNK